MQRKKRRASSLEPAGASLEKIVSETLRRVSGEQAPLLAWPLVCGSAVAERTRVVGFSGAVLRVEVSDRGWKKELEALAPRYLATINGYVEGVKRIEFVVANDGQRGNQTHRP